MKQVAAFEAWDFVEAGLKTIQCRGYTNWEISDIRERLDAGLCGLYVCDDGFLILELDHEPFSSRRFLNVWLAWFRPGKAKKRKSELIAFLDAMQREKGCEWWQFSSPRTGWMFEIEPECEPHMIIWRRKA